MVINVVKIGVPLKYGHLADGRCNLYIAERVRRTLQNAGAFVIPIVPVQDVDYCDTKYDQFNELTDEEKNIIDEYLDMVDGIFFSGGYKITPYDRYLLERCIERDIPTLGYVTATPESVVFDVTTIYESSFFSLQYTFNISAGLTCTF